MVSANRAGEANVTVELTESRPEADIVILDTVRPGQLTGRVIDDVTLEPLEDVPVYHFRTSFVNSQRVAYRRVAKLETRTDRYGRFTVDQVLPGEYVLSLRPSAQDRKYQVSDFSVEDLQRTDEGYAVKFWPGGADLQQAIPLHLESGGFADAGTLRVHKSPQFRPRPAHRRLRRRRTDTS